MCGVKYGVLPCLWCPCPQALRVMTASGCHLDASVLLVTVQVSTASSSTEASHVVAMVTGGMAQV